MKCAIFHYFTRKKNLKLGLRTPCAQAVIIDPVIVLNRTIACVHKLVGDLASFSDSLVTNIIK